MSPRRPNEPLGQRRLALILRTALARHDRDAVLDLIRDHPVGVRSSHVRHNLSAAFRERLHYLIAESVLEAAVQRVESYDFGQAEDR